MRVFIAGPLLAARDLDLDFYESVAAACNEAGFEPFVPHRRIEQHGGNAAIFEEDVKAVRSSDLVVAEVGNPSHGVGGELMQAYLETIPIVCLAAIGSKVSAMVLGNPMVQKVITYDNRDDCIRELKQHLQAFLGGGTSGSARSGRASS